MPHGAAEATTAGQTLLPPWPGPYGGLPPFERVTPDRLESALSIAMDRKRAEVRAITSNPAPPTFENTVLALEQSGRDLEWMKNLISLYRSTMNSPEVSAVVGRLAALLPLVDDEVAHDDALFARISAVYGARGDLTLDATEDRLLTAIYDRMRRQGAGLPQAAQARLETINARTAELQARFAANLIAVGDTEAVFIDCEADLDGLSAQLRELAAKAAADRGRPGQWAVANTFEMVWPFLTQSKRRNLRERVWRMSDGRCLHDGELDNRPLANEILRLRAQKARLLGYPTFAAYTIADRMAGTPQAVLALLRHIWNPVKDATLAQLADLQGLADREGATFPLAPWDRRYYAERLRRERFNLDAEAVKEYLTMENVLAAMFFAVERFLGIVAKEIGGVAVAHPSIRVFELSRSGEIIGILYLDVVPRAGKQRGSWQMEYRTAETGETRIVPIASLNSNPPAAVDGQTLLGWEHANVFFHELGHALHMLCNRAPYPSLGSMAVPWDFIELPSLLNERWLLDRELLQRCCRHHRTGEPMPADMVEAIAAGIRYDRVFTLTLDAVVSAVVDIRLHSLTEDAEFDASKTEQAVLDEFGFPAACDLIQHASASFHLFAGTGAYAAALYSYLWADVMAADVAEAFLAAPGRLYDRAVAARYEQTLLGAGNTVPAAQAFRNFLGRDPDPAALLRRFGMVTA